MRPRTHIRTRNAPATARGPGANVLLCRTFRDGPSRDRTCDLGIKSPLLYQLSYRPRVPESTSESAEGASGGAAPCERAVGVVGELHEAAHADALERLAHAVVGAAQREAAA